MEEIKAQISKPRSIIWKFGIILGFITIAFSFMLYMQELHYTAGTTVQIVTTILVGIAIAFGVYEFKKTNEGFLTVSDSLKIGVGIALIAGIMGLFYFYIQSTFLEPDYWEKATEIGKITALEQNPELTEEQIDQGIEIQKNFRWLFYPIGIIINMVIGLIFGLIIGLVMKKQKLHD